MISSLSCFYLQGIFHLARSREGNYPVTYCNLLHKSSRCWLTKAWLSSVLCISAVARELDAQQLRLTHDRGRLRAAGGEALHDPLELLPPPASHLPPASHTMTVSQAVELRPVVLSVHSAVLLLDNCN